MFCAKMCVLPENREVSQVLSVTLNYKTLYFTTLSHILEQLPTT